MRNICTQMYVFKLAMYMLIVDFLFPLPFLSPPSSLHLPQSSEQEALRLLKEEKASSDSQHKAQLSALSSNLATVRQQLEGEKRKAQEMERRLHSQEKLIDGGNEHNIIEGGMRVCFGWCDGHPLFPTL